MILLIRYLDEFVQYNHLQLEIGLMLTHLILRVELPKQLQRLNSKFL